MAPVNVFRKKKKINTKIPMSNSFQHTALVLSGPCNILDLK